MYPKLEQRRESFPKYLSVDTCEIFDSQTSQSQLGHPRTAHSFQRHGIDARIGRSSRRLVGFDTRSNCKDGQGRGMASGSFVLTHHRDTPYWFWIDMESREALGYLPVCPLCPEDALCIWYIGHRILLIGFHPGSRPVCLPSMDGSLTRGVQVCRSTIDTHVDFERCNDVPWSLIPPDNDGEN